MTVPPVQFAVGPVPSDELARAIALGGGTLGDVAASVGLIWNGGEPSQLAALLAGNPQVRWVQLCNAGVEQYLPLVDSTERRWTRVSGVFGPQVAEHALALLLALDRRLDAYARQRRWSEIQPRQTLLGTRILIIGAGSIAENLIRLITPFEAEICVVRRRALPMPGAKVTVRWDTLIRRLPDAEAVVVAAPLTAETKGVIAAEQLRAMSPSAVLVNVARGQHVVTDDLVTALRAGEIAAAGLDVTDPEPLPPAHPLWQMKNCLITPHVANPTRMKQASRERFVTDNVTRYLLGDALVGEIDPRQGF